MPSHISHALLVEEALASIDSDTIEAERTIAVLGSQGPDIFLHNHRRKPRAFRYGALLHRKGNATVVRSLAESAASIVRETGADSLPLRELAAFTLGYVSHIWLDRLAHPYINYSAGWRGMPDHDPERPAMHAFLERIIDVQLLRRQRNLSIEEYNFLGRLPSSKRDLKSLRTHIAVAIRTSLRSAADDHLLEQRLANALFDSIGYYRYTESPGAEYFALGRDRERAGLVSSRWLSVVHPPEELCMVDALNRERRNWQHPCDPSRTSNATFQDVFERALAHTLEVYSLWMDAALGDATEKQYVRLEEAIGDANLNDGIIGDPPCRRKTCDPLPLLQLYRRIKTAFDR